MQLCVIALTKKLSLFLSPQKFRRVRKEDAGEYYCQAQNDAGHAQCPPQMMEVCEWHACVCRILKLTYTSLRQFQKIFWKWLLVIGYCDVRALIYYQSLLISAMISSPCEIYIEQTKCPRAQNYNAVLMYVSRKCLFSVADDVDILGIFLKSFAAVAVFFCLAASICHSLKRGCFHKKGHNENKWVWSTALKKAAGSIAKYSTLIPRVLMFLFLYFSYNWPAQNDGVNYRDADEVNTVCDSYTEMYCLSPLPLTEGFCVDTLLHLCFPQGHFRHKSSFVIWWLQQTMEPRQKAKTVEVTLQQWWW